MDNHRLNVAMGSTSVFFVGVREGGVVREVGFLVKII